MLTRTLSDVPARSLRPFGLVIKNRGTPGAGVSAGAAVGDAICAEPPQAFAIEANETRIKPAIRALRRENVTRKGYRFQNAGLTI
jgi:hypothetical protein